MSAVEFSVAIVCFRSRPLLDRLVAALRSQTRRAVSWVVHVNGPDDGAAAFWAAQPERPDLVTSVENLGFAGGMNSCLARVTTSHVLLLNPDAIPQPDFLEKIAAAFEGDSKLGAVGGKILLGDVAEGVIDSAGIDYSPWGRWVDVGHGRRDDGRFDDPREVSALCGAAVAYDVALLRSIAEDGQIFDEDFFMYKEDVDLALRVCEVDRRLLYAPAAVVIHRRGFRYGARRDVPAHLRRISLRNRYLLLVKHWKWRRDLWRLPFILAFDLAVFLVIVAREREIVGAFGDALRLARRMLGKRRRRAAVGRSRRDV